MVQVIDGLADLARGTAVNTQVSGLPRTLNSPWVREELAPARDPFDDRFSRLGMAGVLTTGLVGAVAVVTVGFNAIQFDMVGPPPPPFVEFSPVAIGTPQQKVDNEVGEGDLIAEVVAHNSEPRRPQQSVCHYWYDDSSVGRTVLIERLCFRNGVLVHKTQFTARTAPRTVGA
jgi:hypothetical protein